MSPRIDFKRKYLNAGKDKVVSEDKIPSYRPSVHLRMGWARFRVHPTQQACFSLLKTLFPLLNRKAALVSCTFISCVNTLPSFLPQLQHLPAAEGNREAAYLQRMLSGGQKHGLAVLRSAPREATGVHSHQGKVLS